MFPSFEIASMQVYSYPLIIGMVWAYSFFYIKDYFDIKKIHFPYWNLYYISTFLVAWLAAKVFFIYTLDSQFIESIELNANFWLGGGFVFYGGLIGAVIWTIIYKYAFRVSWDDFSIFVPTLAIGHGFGRIGCLLAGCCFGSETSSVLSVHLHGASRHPVQLYEALMLLALGYVFRKRVTRSKFIVVEYLMSYSLMRFVLEFLRGDTIRGQLGFLSTSQWVSLFIVVVCMSLNYFAKQKSQNEL